jgi:hypothetical protein
VAPALLTKCLLQLQLSYQQVLQADYWAEDNLDNGFLQHDHNPQHTLFIGDPF